ncbi:Acg family FMN-binding oxidoreductase [Egbenema bharatensis]|uniref:Acg family FMN-binding oxidoreductase n=1 Tax=Egbenema bharatensis TaxID=3463334 RepID=UPI003A872FA3
MRKIALSPWQISETDFPAQGTPTEQLQFLLQYAVLAPSSHNTQPWLFKLQNEQVQLYADRSRALPIVDPQDRALIISCGAALFNLCLAIRQFGYTDIVKLFPDASQADLLAQVQLGEPYHATATEQALFRAIPHRHTHRPQFLNQALSPDFLITLQSAAIAEHTWLEFISQANREAVADLIAEGDRRQMKNPQFRRELSDWIHPNRSPHRDGMPGYAHGFSDWLSYAGPFVIQHFDLSHPQAKKDRQLAQQAPALAVLGTAADRPEDWIAAGQALSHVLLLARSQGVMAAFMNQPIEVAELRPQLSQQLKQSGYPQLLMRLGFGADIKPTPRRSIEEVLLSST